MNNITFIKNYRHIARYRHSFNDLTQRTYGFDFETWYTQGYWGDDYIPYSFCDADKIIANVSVNLMNLVIDGTAMRAVQLGTVMTDEAFRNRGLSRDLMKLIISEFEDKTDFMYLFANKSVLDFYPKFGFIAAQEYECHTLNISEPQNYITRKLDINDEIDKAILFRLVENMKPLSKLSCLYNTGLVMFYCASFYKENIWYLPELDIAVVFEETDSELNLLEIFSANEVEIDSIVGAFAGRGITKIVFGFTPKISSSDYIFTAKANADDTLFIRSKDILNLPKVMFPVFSHA